MKKKIFVIFLILILLGVFIYIVFLQKKLTICMDNNSENVDCNNNENIDNDDENVSNVEKEYDCSFIQTYHVVDLLDGYIAEVPEISYVILDKYMAHNAISHIIPSNLKNKLEINKYYEFEYKIKGKGSINNMNDIYQQILSTELYNQASDEKKQQMYKDKKIFVYLTIRETDKKGAEQVQENICK